MHTNYSEYVYIIVSDKTINNNNLHFELAPTINYHISNMNKHFILQK